MCCAFSKSLVLFQRAFLITTWWWSPCAAPDVCTPALAFQLPGHRQCSVAGSNVRFNEVCRRRPIHLLRGNILGRFFDERRNGFGLGYIDCMAPLHLDDT